ncbi:DUF421 domain-containing protein [Acetobacteraceae bacterium]|nr:DUF421 domain-containing protein [Acetobacteraceae bacterium]
MSHLLDHVFGDLDSYFTLSKMSMSFYLSMLWEILTGFAVVIAYLRFTGRTQFSQMNAIDLIGNFIIGGVIGCALFSPSITFMTYLVALVLSVMVLGVLNYLYLHVDFFHRVTVGNPIPVIRDGKFLMKPILSAATKVDVLNVTSQLNLQGIFCFNEVAYAQLEPNGALTVTKNRQEIPAVTIIYEGTIRKDALEAVEKTSEDLLADFKKYGIESEKEIFLAEYAHNGFRYICLDGHVFPKAANPEMVGGRHLLAEVKAEEKDSFSSAGL